ncbi:MULTISPECIES: ROK family protein [Thalassospira]|uniref:N-acetylglucosamine kinase n=2 Tax=Thalassospira TaxID=168934 RepID=A0A367WC13_9PROT|nr:MULTISPECIES: ROK family protein [Thalassospira]MDG4717560.1 ROK family protein [Thalassospira sp. FZY0004]RCK38973.1 ROK family transcriptional regulator [Thalassospira profundimaris]
MQYAFDIGGSKIEFGVFSDAGDVMLHSKMPTPKDDLDAFVAAIQDLIGDADTEFGERPDIGISYAGGLDPQTGAVISANVPAIKGWRLAAELSTILNRKVLVENDADCFALAEAISGAAKDSRTVFAIILGTGVGGGIVVDGHFIGGKSGIRGEWGHGNDVTGTLIRNGLAPVQCGCGQTGCLDAWGGARGLEHIHSQISGNPVTSFEITDAWRAGDAHATRAVEIYCELVARELALMVNVLDPDCVPVGGGMASEKVIISTIDGLVRDRVLGRYDAPLVVPGTFAKDGGLRGAAMLHLGQRTVTTND